MAAALVNVYRQDQGRAVGGWKQGCKGERNDTADCRLLHPR